MGRLGQVAALVRPATFQSLATTEGATMLTVQILLGTCVVLLAIIAGLLSTVIETLRGLRHLDREDAARQAGRQS